MSLQIGLQAWIMFFQAISSTTLCPNTISWKEHVSRFYLFHSYFDGISGDFCLPSYQNNISSLFGLQRKKLSVLLFIEHLTHLLIFFCSVFLLHFALPFPPVSRCVVVFCILEQSTLFCLLGQVICA